ncbi:hypothetical protein ASF61_20370 [Duganella sp. Leaf126]|nr:hypothetical protein ASF61_20370 [Duganella sp. Leaf126]
MKLTATLSLAAASLLSACGGGSTATSAPPSAYADTRLVADVAGTAPNTDANLINAWGIAFNPTGYVWVANTGTGTSTLYDGNGVPQPLVVKTPPAPIGIVFNGSGTDFNGSPFVFSTALGAIAAWSPATDAANAATVVDNSASGTSYLGLALATYNGANYLYAADFANDKIDVLDAKFAKATLPGSFTDPKLPAGYGPYNIQTIGSRIYVAYAKHAGRFAEHAVGSGVIDVFDTGGNLLKQLVVGGTLNAPWGMTQAPANFGSLSGKLLVGNFGDGLIQAYDPDTGAAAGMLQKADGSKIAIDGLWGLAFGNGVNNQPTNTLFYTAGPNGSTHGLYGRIDVK